MNCCDDKISSYSCKVGAHFQNLHMLVGLILKFSDELLKNFFALHRSVSFILIHLTLRTSIFFSLDSLLYVMQFAYFRTFLKFYQLSVSHYCLSRII